MRSVRNEPAIRAAPQTRIPAAAKPPGFGQVVQFL